MTDQHASIAPLVATLASTTLDTPRIYVACLAAYNNGRLHGRWIDATDPHKVWEQVNAMLAASPEPAQALRASARWRSMALSNPSVSTSRPSRRKASWVRSSGKP